MSPPLPIFLTEALDQTLANPAASHCWHHLFDLCGDVDREVRSSIQEFLEERIPAAGVPGFFCATFLAGLTGNTAYVAEAGRIVQTIEPFDAERLVSFLVYQWAVALRSQMDRSGFVQHLRQASLPEIVSQAGENLANKISERPALRKFCRVGRVALVTPYISNSNHTPTTVAFNHARLLIEHGLDVHIFSAQDTKPAQMHNYLGNKGTIIVTSPDVGELRSLIPDKLTVTFSIEHLSLMQRWAEMLKLVSAFDPDLVFFVGLFSPLITPLYQTRPVLGLNIHSVQPMAPVDVWLTSRTELSNQISHTWGPALPGAWGFHHPYRVALKATPENPLQHDLGLPKDACVLITVGYRLPREITGTWARQMAQLLKTHPDIVWLLVGGEGLLPPALAEVAYGQLRLIPNQSAMKILFRCSDIYINPPRMGGGFSVAEAMAEGLPVVSYAHSDGGDKIGTAAVACDAEYFSRLESLLHNSDLRKQEGMEMRKLFSQKLDLQKSGPSLLAACELALERYHLRANPATS
jgi:hypothetical protein